MKKKDKQKLVELTPSELQKKLETELKMLMEIKMKKQTGKLKDLHEYAKKRKEIAVIKTILAQRMLLAGKGETS